MRFFTLIFSFYLLAQAIVPCSDKDDCNYLITEQSTSHSEHKQDTEHCTPFCICACCGQIFTVQFYPTTFADSPPISSQDFPIYNTSFVSEVYFSIWQPPKINA